MLEIWFAKQDLCEDLINLIDSGLSKEGLREYLQTVINISKEIANATLEEMKRGDQDANE